MAEDPQEHEPQTRPGTVPEGVLWEKLGRQAVEIDLLRADLQALAIRNSELEAQLAAMREADTASKD